MNQIQQPEDMPRLFVANWNNRRADLLAELFEANADFINVVGLWWENRPAIFKAHAYGLQVIFPNSTLQAGRIKVNQLSEDAAIVHARMQLTGQTAPEGQAGTRHTIFTFVLRRNGTYWLCVSAQNTDIVPGAETYIRTEGGTLRPADYRKK